MIATAARWRGLIAAGAALAAAGAAALAMVLGAAGPVVAALAGLAAGAAALLLARRAIASRESECASALVAIAQNAESQDWEATSAQLFGDSLMAALREVRACLARARDESSMNVAERMRELEAALDKAGEAEQSRRALLVRTTAAMEDERRRLSQEIHDSVGATIMVVALLAERLRDCLRSLPDGVSGRATIVTLAERLQESSAAAYRSARHLAKTLRSEVLDTLGLSDALRDLVAEFAEAKADCRFVYSADPGMPTVRGEVALALYRVAQEALANVTKHSRADEVLVKFARTEQRLTLTVTDNGLGFSRAGADGLGILSMRERMRAVGGSLNIISTPASTTLKADVSER